MGLAAANVLLCCRCNHGQSIYRRAWTAVRLKLRPCYRKETCLLAS